MIYDGWDHFWQAGGGGSLLSRQEALALKILLGILVLMLLVTLFMLS